MKIEKTSNRKISSHLAEPNQSVQNTGTYFFFLGKTFVSFIPLFVFGFWSLLAMKLRKYYIIFVYILQGKMGKMEKKLERKSRN